MNPPAPRPAPHRPSDRGWLLLTPALSFLCLFYLVPLVQVVLLSFRGAPWTLAHYGRIFQDPVQLEVLGYTLGLAGSIAAFTLLVGYPVAYLLATTGERLRRLLLLLILASVWISILVRSYAWMVLLARHGPVNGALQAAGIIEEPLPLLYNDFSVIVSMVHIMLPFMILPLYSVMQRIDPRLVHAARSLGASPFLAFWSIIFPLSLPGVLAGTVLVFIISIGFFITPALLGGIGNTTFVMLIEQEVNQFLNWELAAAMSVVLLFATLVLVVIYQNLLAPRERAGRDRAGLLGRASGSVRRWLIRSTAVLNAPRPGGRADGAGTRLVEACDRASHLLIRTFPWFGIAFLLAPLVIIFPLSLSAAPFLEFPPSAWSLRWYEAVYLRPDWIDPALTSMRIALIVVLVSTCLGLMAAVPLARGDSRFRPIVTGFLLSPMIVPVIVLALAMHFFTSRIGLAGTVTALVIGHVVLALPFVVIVMSNALKSVDVNLERAAITLGATPYVAFTRVTLPLVRPAVLTSALFAFLASFDELVVALFLAGPTTRTLPKRMWEAIRQEIDPTVAAVAVLVTLICLAALWFAEAARSRVGLQGARMGGAPGTQALEFRRRGLFR